MLSISVLEKVLNNCIYIHEEYKPTLNSEPFVKPNIRPVARVWTILKNQQIVKMRAYK